MGSGTSSDALKDTKFGDNTTTTTELPFSKQVKTKWSSTATKIFTGAVNVLIICQTNQQNAADRLRSQLVDLKFNCYTLTDTTPSSIVARANLVRWSDVFISLISRSYQRAFCCMETINYAKDIRKPIVVILGESNFQPYGALGAISAGAVHTMLLDDGGISENVLT
ncbi:unnamed protein product [Rotaria socialis]|uniref:TIR domain-containing protein n=1 Tax=Rotaria socialis TaxID=392032 RepID=A0A820NAZ2_9BILA|nr:unnamed protein product [Rotaria socialis]CAF3570142.1 unnamed protein product [Rotaria socialis]CAF4384461.1 unnamed protein product [Rotaria socialis]CAF4892396.1 unnamed protein product [Rotaria socialis]